MTDGRKVVFRAETLSALRLLQSFFDDDLYVVGGAVREGLCGNSRVSDVDICGRFLPSEVKRILENSPFSARDTAAKFGTLKIILGDNSFEYTTFRKDSYSRGGKHAPDKVDFTTDLEEDSLRRDFTVNAVYYDIRTDEIVDPRGGVRDLDDKILRAVRDPDKVLSEDGLRLLRLVRFSCSLGLEIEEKTLISAKNNASLLRDVAPERIREEFDKILVADTVRGIKGAQTAGLRLMDEIGLLEILLPEYGECKGYKQNADFHKYTVDEHILRAVGYAPERLRLVALLHDIGKPSAKRKYGKTKMHGVESAEIARRFLSEYRYSNRETERVVRLILAHMTDVNSDMPEDDLRVFIRNNADIIDDLIAFRIADSRAKGFCDDVPESALRMRGIFDEMKRDGVPFVPKDLYIDGNDLISLGVPEKDRATTIKDLLDAACIDKTLLSREAQIDFVKSRLPLS